MSFGAFTFIYFSLAFILFILILFEKKLIELEDKHKKARKDKIKDLKKIIAIQDKVIDLQHDKIREYGKALSTQKMVNSIDRETLRQERLQKEKSNKKGNEKND